MEEWKKFYSDIILTEQEIKEAIELAKRRKYFRELHAPYWKELEEKNQKPVKK
jgi:hypothetical protein